MDIKIITVLITCLISSPLVSQNTFDFLNKGVTRTTTRKGEKAEPQPAANSEYFKIKCNILKDSIHFALYAKEFKGGKHVPDDFERINSGLFFKGDKLIWEIVPDLSDKHHLKLFMYFPGMTVCRQKLTSLNKCFKYRLYKETQSAAYGKNVPLMLVYEDDLYSGEVERFINEFAGQGLLEPVSVKNEKLLAGLDRYIIIYYRLID